MLTRRAAEEGLALETAPASCAGGCGRGRRGAPSGRPRPSLDLLRTGHGQNSPSRKQQQCEVCVCKTQTVDQAHSGPRNCVRAAHVLGLFPGRGTGPPGVGSGTAIRPWPEPSSPVSISVHSEADRSQGARGWGSLDLRPASLVLHHSLTQARFCFPLKLLVPVHWDCPAGMPPPPPLTQVRSGKACCMYGRKTGFFSAR